MQNNDNPADPFKKALAEATKVMADDAELSVTYSVDPPGATNDSIRLPQVSRRMTAQEVRLARGTADALALRHKFHDASTFDRYVPQGQMARDIYDAMETARCEAVGGRAMPGTHTNIDAKIETEALRQGFGDIREASQAPLATAAGYLVRHLATGRDLPPDAANVMNLWRDFIEGQTDGSLFTIEDNLADQAEFAKFTRKIIRDLGYGDQLGDDPDFEDEGAEDQADAEDNQEDQPDSTGEDDDAEEQDDANPEILRRSITFFDDCKKKQQPFCLFVGSHDSHAPFTTGDPSRYDHNKISVPSYWVDTPELRKELVKYYAEVSNFDFLVGMIRAELERRNLWDNTILIVCSEQGSQLPFAKWTCYDNGLRTGLVMHWPGLSEPGTSIKELVSIADIQLLPSSTHLSSSFSSQICLKKLKITSSVLMAVFILTYYKYR